MAGDDRPMACKSSPIKVLGETETRAMGAIETVSRRRLRLCHDLRDRSRYTSLKMAPLPREVALLTGPGPDISTVVPWLLAVAKYMKEKPFKTDKRPWAE